MLEMKRLLRRVDVEHLDGQGSHVDRFLVEPLSQFAA
jgi:hypothetical protein